MASNLSVETIRQVAAFVKSLPESERAQYIGSEDARARALAAFQASQKTAPVATTPSESAEKKERKEKTATVFAVFLMYADRAPRYMGTATGPKGAEKEHALASLLAQAESEKAWETSLSDSSEDAILVHSIPLGKEGEPGNPSVLAFIRECESRSNRKAA